MVAIRWPTLEVNKRGSRSAPHKLLSNMNSLGDSYLYIITRTVCTVQRRRSVNAKGMSVISTGDSVVTVVPVPSVNDYFNRGKHQITGAATIKFFLRLSFSVFVATVPTIQLCGRYRRSDRAAYYVLQYYQHAGDHPRTRQNGWLRYSCFGIRARTCCKRLAESLLAVPARSPN